MRNDAGVFAIAVTVAAVVGLAAPAHAQKAINHSRARARGVTRGDAPGYPVTISVSGNYKLTGNLVVPNADNGIHITADRVTIDLNGFSITGPGGGDIPGIGRGVRSEERGAIVVVNGTVTGMDIGIDLPGHSHRVEKVSAQGNRTGIKVGSISIVVSNTLSFNSQAGIEVTGHAGAVIGNVVALSSGYGLLLTATVGYAHNVLHGVGVSGGVQMDTNVCGAAPCP